MVSLRTFLDTTKTCKRENRSDTPLTQYSKNAFVNSVRVDDTVNVSLRVHGNERETSAKLLI